MMELNWKSFVELFNNSLVPNTLTTYAIEKAIETVVDKLKTNSRDSLEEQLILCLNSSMERLWKKYQFEYDIEVFTEIVYNLIEKREDITEKAFEELIKAGIIKKEKSLTEIAEEEKPFKIPKSWKWVKLNSIVEVITDGDHQPSPQVEAGVPFLVISNMSQGNLSFINTRNVSQEYYDALQEARKPQNGDILFTVTGSYGIVIPIKTDKAFCVQRHIALIKKPFVSVDYLVKCLSSPYSYKQCKEKATGTAQKTVGLETLRNLILPLPPLAEQERIVAELEKVLPYCQKIVK